MTSRSMALRSIALRSMALRSIALRSMAFTCLSHVPEPRILICRLSHRIGFFQLREISLLLELLDDAELEIVFDLVMPDVGTDRGELLDHVPGTLDRRCRIARHEA